MVLKISAVEPELRHGEKSTPEGLGAFELVELDRHRAKIFERHRVDAQRRCLNHSKRIFESLVVSLPEDRRKHPSEYTGARPSHRDIPQTESYRDPRRAVNVSQATSACA